MLGALIGAGASLASSLLGNKSNEKARANEAAQQREFAQNGIQWKVADAKAAGVHPLYALGANTVSYSPQSVGGSDFGGLAAAGQDIGRAIDSTRSQTQRSDALSSTLAALQVDGLKIDNDIKRADLASKLATIRGQSGPALPNAATTNLYGLDGVGDLTVDGPTLKLQTQRDLSDPRFPGHVPGAGPSTAFVDTGMGGYEPVIPSQLQEAYESDELGSFGWQARNRVLAPLMGSAYAPRFPVLPWQTRYYNWKKFQWEKRDRSDFPNRYYGRFNTRR